MENYSSSEDGKYDECAMNTTSVEMTNGNVGDSELPNVIDENGCHNLYIMLNSIIVNLNQIVENCFDVHARMNELEMDCIDLLQPMGDIISLEKELKRVCEILSNYKNMLEKSS